MQLSIAAVKTDRFRNLFKSVEKADAQMPLKFNENWPLTPPSCLKISFIELPKVVLHTISISCQTFLTQFTYC